MPTRTQNRKNSPGKQAAGARAVLANSAADKDEVERFRQLPQWARFRIVELTQNVVDLKMENDAMKGLQKEVGRVLPKLAVLFNRSHGFASRSVHGNGSVSVQVEE